MESIIKVKGLTKSYGEIKAVQGVDFEVKAGSLFAFLGPNGAGKSTTIDMLCTQLQPDAGDVLVDGRVLGKEDADIRRAIGVVFQTNVLDDLLTVKENMEVRGSFYGLKGKALDQAVQKAAQAAEVLDFFNRPYGKLSGGQKRRADIARALVNTPKILFLDEPTTGLDPQTRKSVWNTVRALQEKEGMTVFLTTHYMEEAATADDVAIIDEGKIVARGTPLALRAQYARDTLRMTPKDMEGFASALTQDGVTFERTNGSVVVPLKKTLDAIDLLEKYKDSLVLFEVACGNMDDAFIAITGKEIRA